MPSCIYSNTKLGYYLSEGNIIDCSKDILDKTHLTQTIRVTRAEK